MARRFTCGCEEPDISAMWDYVDTFGAENQTGLPHLGWNDMVSWSPRTGRGMYVMNNQMMVRNILSDNPTEMYFGFAMYTKSIGGNTSGFIYATTDSVGVYSEHLSLWLTDDGCIQLKRSGTEIARSLVNTIQPGIWYHIQWWAKPRNSAGRCVVKVNNATVIDFTGDTTNDLEVVSAYNFQGIYHLNPYLTAFDDIVVNDTSGSVNNSWPGIVRLLPIRPKAAGNYAQWGRGGVDLGSDAAQVRNGSFDYTMLQTSGSGNKVTFDVETPDIISGATIKNIIVNAKARITSGSGFIAPMVRANGVDSLGSSRSLGTNWKFYQTVWDINPEDSSPWAEADIANLEIGVSS